MRYELSYQDWFKRDKLVRNHRSRASSFAGATNRSSGDGIAGRGESTELGILGAVIGGIAGAAIGDSVSDCENFNRSNTQGFQTNNPVYTQPTTVYSNPRTVYTSPRIVTPAPVYRTQSPVYRTNTSYSNNRGFNQTQNRLFQIDREIDRLCDEIDIMAFAATSLPRIDWTRNT